MESQTANEAKIEKNKKPARLSTFNKQKSKVILEQGRPDSEDSFSSSKHEHMSVSQAYSHRSALENDLKLISMLKLFASDAFRLLSEEEFSFEQKLKILKMQKERIIEVTTTQFTPVHSAESVSVYLGDLDNKIKSLSEAIVDEKLYYNTMPQKIYEARKAKEDLNAEKLSKFEQNVVSSFVVSVDRSP